MLRRRSSDAVWHDAGPATLRTAYAALVAANPLPLPEKRAALRYLLGDSANTALDALDPGWRDGSLNDLSASGRIFIDMIQEGRADAFPLDVAGHEARAWRDLVAFAQQAHVMAVAGAPL